jgi:hypothetical protein
MIGKSIANAISAINKIEARTGRSQMLTTPTSVKPKPPALALRYSCALAKTALRLPISHLRQYL